MRPVVLLFTAITVLAVACDDPTPTPTPTPLIPHPTLAPPLTWDAIDDELADPSSTWRKEHLFRVFANTLQSHDTELKKYDNKILTIEGPYSHRTEIHTIHLQWPYLEHTFTINCGISPRPNAGQFAYLDSIQQNAPTMTVRGEFLYKPGQLPGFYYSEKNADGGFNVYLDLVYNYCQILTVDGRPWPPLPPITLASTPTATPDPVVTPTATPVPKPSPTPTATPVPEPSADSHDYHVSGGRGESRGLPRKLHQHLVRGFLRHAQRVHRGRLPGHGHRGRMDDDKNLRG